MANKIIILKNTTINDHIVVNGYLLEGSGQIDVSNSPREHFANDDALLALIASGDIVVNNGVVDFSPANGIGHIIEQQWSPNVILYTDGEGAIHEKTLGPAGSVLASSGFVGSPTWSDPSIFQSFTATMEDGVVVANSVFNLDFLNHFTIGNPVLGTSTIELNLPNINISDLTNDLGFTTDHTLLTNIGTNTHAQIDTHIANTSNPHAVTLGQLGDVDLTGLADTNILVYNSTTGNFEPGTDIDTGEVNTASNVGTAGVGVFKQKTGTDLEFKNINAGSNKVTVTEDVANNEIDVDIVPSNINISELNNDSSFAPDQNLFETVTADTGSTTANTTTDTINVVGGTKISTTIIGDTLTIDADTSHDNQVDINDVAGDGSVHINTVATTNTNVDLVLDPAGTGLVVAPSGYDMSVGGPKAFATKDYVDFLSGHSVEHNDSIILTTAAIVNFEGNVTVTDEGNGKGTVSVGGTTGLLGGMHQLIYTEDNYSCGNKWLGLADANISSSTTFGIAPWRSKLVGITFSNKDTNANTIIKIYSTAEDAPLSPKTLDYSWTITNQRSARKTNFITDIIFDAGDKIGLYLENNGQNPDHPVVTLYFQILDDVTGEGNDNQSGLYATAIGGGSK